MKLTTDGRFDFFIEGVGCCRRYLMQKDILKAALQIKQEPREERQVTPAIRSIPFGMLEGAILERYNLKNR